MSGLDEVGRRWEGSGLLRTHIAFLEALRGAGVPVSLAEGLDAVAAFSVLDWGDRDAIRQGYAATLVKRPAQRPTFETLFDLYFPRLVGEGVRDLPEEGEGSGAGQGREEVALTSEVPPGIVSVSPTWEREELRLRLETTMS